MPHKEQVVAEILQGVIADCTEASQVDMDAVGMVCGIAGGDISGGGEEEEGGEERKGRRSMI